MEEQQNSTQLPEIPTAEQQRREELKRYWLDPTKDYPSPHCLFQYQGIRFSPLGGIQAMSGQRKNGKTFVLAQLMAAALGEGKPKIKQYLPGLELCPSTLEYLGHPPKVLYSDTEMEMLNTAKVMRRVQWLCDCTKQPNDRFFIQWLREVPKSEQQSSRHERWRIIKNAIDEVSPDIVFIDGLRDLVDNFNDPIESSDIIEEMMSLASHRDICIWMALHMNPRPANDDESKMRGHLGTELGNKITDSLASIKKKDSLTGKVKFTVKQLDARDKDMPDWEFEVVDDAGDLGIPRIISDGQPTFTDEETAERIEANNYFAGFKWPRNGASYSSLIDYLNSKGVTSNRKKDKLRDVALEAGIIYKADGKYYYRGLATRNDEPEQLDLTMVPDKDVPF